MVHHPRHAVGVMGRLPLAAPLPLHVMLQLLPLDTGALALPPNDLAESRHRHPLLPTPLKETVPSLRPHQLLRHPSCRREILERKTATVTGAQKTMVGEVTLKATTGVMMPTRREVDANEENLVMQTSHRHHLTEVAGMIHCLLKRLTCLSQVRCCQSTRNVMSVSETATTRAGAVMDAEWITIAHGHRLPPWPACHHAVAWTWICIAWIIRTHPAHETKTAGASQT